MRVEELNKIIKGLKDLGYPVEDMTITDIWYMVRSFKGVKNENK